MGILINMQIIFTDTYNFIGTVNIMFLNKNNVHSAKARNPEFKKVVLL